MSKLTGLPLPQMQTMLRTRLSNNSSRPNRTVTLGIGLLLLAFSTLFMPTPVSAQTESLTGKSPLFWARCLEGDDPSVKKSSIHNGNRWSIEYSARCDTAWLRVENNEVGDGHYYLVPYDCAEASSRCRGEAQGMLILPGYDSTSYMISIYEAAKFRACYSKYESEGPFETCSPAVEVRPDPVPEGGFGPLVI